MDWNKWADELPTAPQWKRLELERLAYSTLKAADQPQESFPRAGRVSEQDRQHAIAIITALHDTAPDSGASAEQRQRSQGFVNSCAGTIVQPPWKKWPE